MATAAKGLSAVSISISGPNEHWAHVNAYQVAAPTPAQVKDGNSRSGAALAPGTTGNPVSTPGKPSGGLSDAISLALIAYGGGWIAGVGSSSHIVGQGGGEALDAASPGSLPSVQGAPNPQSQVLAGLQSLVTALTGAGPASGNEPLLGTATTPSQTGTNPRKTSSDTSAQQVSTAAPEEGLIASASATPQPDDTGRISPNLPPPNDDLSDTVTDARGNTKPRYSDGVRLQFALSSYRASAPSGLDSPATTMLTSITA
jgi:hypothetical protein